VARPFALLGVVIALVDPGGAPAAPLRLAMRATTGTVVELTLENLSDKALGVPKAAAFHLDKGMYWAPAYLTAGASPGSIQISIATRQPADARRSVTIAPRESRKVVIQLADLK
jgi:hypothetical protein